MTSWEAIKAFCTSFTTAKPIDPNSRLDRILYPTDCNLPILKMFGYLVLNALATGLSLLAMFLVFEFMHEFLVRGNLNVAGSIGGTFLVLIFGSILFAARTRLPIQYGILEIIGACLVINYTIWKLPNEGAAGWIGILSSVYFVVRGLDNLTKGLKARKERLAKLDNYTYPNTNK